MVAFLKVHQQSEEAEFLRNHQKFSKVELRALDKQEKGVDVFRKSKIPGLPPQAKQLVPSKQSFLPILPPSLLPSFLQIFIK